MEVAGRMEGYKKGVNSSRTNYKPRAGASCSENDGMKKKKTERATIYELHISA
jgi:hypothetical protein